MPQKSSCFDTKRNVNYRYAKDVAASTKMALKTMVDSLPALFLIQRNFSGKLLGNIPTTAKVVLSLSTVGAPETKTLNLWFNNQAQSYSGFVYFVFDNLQHSWNTSVAVYDSADKLQAKTQAVDFNTSAGDIQFADISIDMYRPKILNVTPGHIVSAPGLYNMVTAAYSASWLDVSKDTLDILVSDTSALAYLTITNTNVYLAEGSATRHLKVYNGAVVVDSALFRWAAALKYSKHATSTYLSYSRLWVVGVNNRFGDPLLLPQIGDVPGGMRFGLTLKATDYPDPAWVCAQYAGATAAALAEIGCPLK